MGFLDHSSSNIIVDAVLTDAGRQFLANNDGSFKITRFSFADDEVDYTIIKKFGRVIGKEKIEKNTPIFEAQTSTNLALKYPCITAQSADLRILPIVDLTTATTSGYIVLNPTTTSKSLNFKQTFISDRDPMLIDTRFTVKVPNSFVALKDTPTRDLSPDYVDRDGIAYYSVNATASATTSDPEITFIIASRSITEAQYNIYGTSDTGGKKINFVCSITGNNSGVTKLFKVQISNTTV